MILLSFQSASFITWLHLFHLVYSIESLSIIHKAYIDVLSMLRASFFSAPMYTIVSSTLGSLSLIKTILDVSDCMYLLIDRRK